MAKVVITIDTANAAFDPMYGGEGVELATILHDVANEFFGVSEMDLDGKKIKDSNGNTVGSVSVGME